MNFLTNISFKGTTKVYAFTDSHQESRKTSAIMSEVLSDAKDKDNALLLYGGDMFKGIYPKELEKDSFIKLKEAKPDMEMVLTLGNNDFGFFKETFDYLVNTVKKFSSKGIHTVCANMFDTETGKRPDWLKPYTVVTRDNDRTFVTGFCVDNVGTAKFGLSPKKSEEVIEEISEAIKKEKPDNVVILNHDYMDSSENLVNKFKEKGIKVDLVIGGHDHDRVEPDSVSSIYYPQSFSGTMYKFDLENNGSRKGITSAKELNWKDCAVSPVFESELEKNEKELGLFNVIAPSVLDLPKTYNDPNPLGSFLADKLMEKGKTDIAFFSTGFLMAPLPYVKDQNITKYRLKKTIAAENPIVKETLTVNDLKTVFENALRGRGYGNSNPKFLQCSNNITLEGKNDAENEVFKLKQIYINGEALLDKEGNPLDSQRTYTCAMDNYIADGGQGYNVLKEKEKTTFMLNNKEMRINDVLENSLIEAARDYKKGESYPCFKIIE